MRVNQLTRHAEAVAQPVDCLDLGLYCEIGEDDFGYLCLDADMRYAAQSLWDALFIARRNETRAPGGLAERCAQALRTVDVLRRKVSPETLDLLCASGEGALAVAGILAEGP